MDYNVEQVGIYTKIAEDGTAATIVYSTIGTYSASTDSFSSAVADVNYPTYMIITKCSKRDFGDQVAVRDKTLVIPAYNLPILDEEDKSHKFVIYVSNKKLIPKNILGIRPGNVPLLYKIQVSW